MQGEHWIIIANFCQILYFAHSLGGKIYSFLKQQFEKMIVEPLQPHIDVCGFYKKYAAFHLLKFHKKKLQELTMIICFHS